MKMNLEHRLSKMNINELHLRSELEKAAQYSRLEEAARQALEALEETRNALAWFYDSYPQDVTKKGNELLPHVEVVLADLRVALTSNSRALEQPAQQEPVAWAVVGDGEHGEYELGRMLEKKKDPNFEYWESHGYKLVPLYATPPAQEFVCSTGLCHYRKPLTDEQIWNNDKIMAANSAYGATFDTLRELTRAIEKAHGITGEINEI